MKSSETTWSAPSHVADATPDATTPWRGLPAEHAACAIEVRGERGPWSKASGRLETLRALAALHRPAAWRQVANQPPFWHSTLELRLDKRPGEGARVVVVVGRSVESGARERTARAQEEALAGARADLQLLTALALPGASLFASDLDLAGLLDGAPWESAVDVRRGYQPHQDLESRDIAALSDALDREDVPTALRPAKFGAPTFRGLLSLLGNLTGPVQVVLRLRPTVLTAVEGPRVGEGNRGSGPWMLVQNQVLGARADEVRLTARALHAELSHSAKTSKKADPNRLVLVEALDELELRAARFAGARLEVVPWGCVSSASAQRSLPSPGAAEEVQALRASQPARHVVGADGLLVRNRAGVSGDARLRYLLPLQRVTGLWRIPLPGKAKA